MAKKPTSNVSATNAAKKTIPPTPAAKPAAPVVSAVRNSPIPKAVAVAAAAPAVKKEITSEMIAKRAYEISRSPASGSEIDNWLKAESELRG